MIMFFQYELGAAARLIAANSMIITNGNATNATGVVRLHLGERVSSERSRSGQGSHREEKL